MKNPMRNLMLSAAALAALTTAPQLSAAPRGEGRFRGDRDQRSYAPHRDFDRDRGFHRDFGRFHSYVAPRFSGYRSYAPFRAFGGLRFYSYCPGPGYVYISDGHYEGWVYPPYFGAAWLPGHYDRFGIWFGGRWR